jgi:hypothetical protein
MMNPLLLATMHGGYTNYIKLLLKAGANPNIPDDVCSVYFLDFSWPVKPSGDTLIIFNSFD